MKLTNAQIKTVDNAYVYLSKIETKCFIQVCTNIIELESHVNKINKFLFTISEKGGWLNEEKTMTSFKTPKDEQIYKSQTEAFFAKTTDIKLDVIKKADLEGLKIPGSLILELVKLKLIV